MMSEDMNNATFSPDLEDGHLHLNGQDGEGQSGPEVVPVSRFRARDSEKAMPTNATSGPLFNASSPSAGPPVVFGEQVASKDGREWLSAVRSDLESMGYACGAADLSAASVGAPHIRQRLFWVAHASGGFGERREGCDSDRQATGWQQGTSITVGSGETSGLGNATVNGIRAFNGQFTTARDDRQQKSVGGSGISNRLGNANQPRPQGRSSELGECAGEQTAGAGSAVDGLGDSASDGCREAVPFEQIHADNQRQVEKQPFVSGSTSWNAVEWLPCADGKARPTQSGIHPLADGIPGRVGQLRSYGNAIVPSVAAVFIQSFMEVVS